ncbi:ABC transporter substrate-binding protein [Mesobaculum littorinae]|uniref:ABC transporter substrate-binding protein n=1 Tax=Mesobaculum littorinae TaxID=2486419 RepID=A0A438AFR3_9RHOB|nr:ABC transporter substrate-binding protein [Mesobaculum littorinae]RVV97522.1 ABC transporter substrate-binding protein [Mesobaculum littorinae]
MQNFIPTRRAAMALILAGTALTGATGQAVAQDITLGALRLTSHSPTYIALERGYFEDEGLNVELAFFESSAAMAVGVAGGDLDYGVTSISGGLMNLAQKGAVKVIGGALAEDPDVQGHVILASNAAFEDGVTEPAQLAGRSFGVTTAGSSFHYMLSRIAEGEGFDIADVQMKPLQKVGAIIGALSSGQVDGWAIQPSIGKRLVEEGAAHKIGDLSDYAPDYQVTAVFTSTGTAEGEREQTEAFLRALSHGVADYNAAFVDGTADEAEVTELTEIVHQYVSTDVDDARFAKDMAEGSMRINEGLSLSTSSLQSQLDWMQDEGLVSGDITLEMLVDPSYVETN